MSETYAVRETLPVASELPPEQPSDDGAEKLVWRD
jgi:hypothetical protein